jgi:hypothetical protein
MILVATAAAWLGVATGLTAMAAADWRKRRRFMKGWIGSVVISVFLSSLSKKTRVANQGIIIQPVS